MNTRNNWIDGMKGIAIIGVVMIHSGGTILGPVGALGQYGVQIFFLISSYLCFVSMDRAFKHRMDIRTVLWWILRKFIRLIPLYYLSIILYVCWGNEGIWLGCENGITMWNVLSHFTFTHGFFPHYVNSIIGVEW